MILLNVCVSILKTNKAKRIDMDDIKGTIND